jgi:tetratricopeptide (TPR) repeat protein
VDVRSRALLWGYHCDEYCTDIFAAQDLISEKVARALALNLTGEDQRRLAKRYTDNIKAYDLYQKGRYFWEKRTGADLKKALEYFEQGIALDPNYALAHAGIAHCYGPLGYLGILAPEIATPRMKVAAIKALELDDTLAEAHTALGAFLAFHEWDWEGAEREFKRAVELNPNYPTTYAWHSQHLENMRRLDESLAFRKRAQELDPLNLTINNFLAYSYSLVGQHDRAIEIYRQTLELDPNFFLAHLYLGYVYERIGRYEEAIAEFSHAVKLSGKLSRASGALAHAYAVSGRQDGARKALNELLELSKQRYISPFDIAIIFTGLGEKEQAFAWFEKAYEKRDPPLSNIKTDHRLERFHSDPRFSSLLRRMRLAP